MSWVDSLPEVKFFKWLRGVLSEPDGTPSSTRVLMYAFSVFSMWLIWRCYYHIFRLHDPTLVTIWLSNMPMLIGTLLGLIALPYGINKGSATFSDIANMISAAKTNGTSTAISGSLSEIKGMLVASPTIPTPPVIPQPVTASQPPRTGNPGVKG